MHLLILGGRGQLARAIQHICADRGDIQTTVWTRPTYDIALPSIRDEIVKLLPDCVINAAAWTAVDAAEEQVTAAYAVNALGPKYVAEGCRSCGAMMVQVSTNEVFAGETGMVYREYDPTDPQSAYARSKQAGEFAASQMCDRLFIVRTAWLFGPGGHNFPSKITAAADRHGALRVVADERGNPSYAPDVAQAIIQLIATERFGIYHLVNRGDASRYEFAQALLRANGRAHVPLTPISHTEWQREANSPLHAVLINQAAAALGIELRPWQEAIQAYVEAEAISI